MKKEIIKMLALLIFGAAALSGCAIENQGRHRRGYNHRYRYYHDRNHDGYNDRYQDRDYGYRN